MERDLLSVEVFPEIMEYLIYFGFVLLLQAASTTIAQLIIDGQEQQVSDYMTGLVQEQALKLDLSYFENPKFHNTHFQAQREAVFRPMRVVTSLMGVLQNSISLILLAGFLSFMSPLVGGVLLISIAPAIIIRYHYSKTMYHWAKQRVAKERESHYLNDVIGNQDHAKEMRVFDAGKKLKKRYSDIRAKLFKEKLHIGKLRARNTLFAKFFEVIAEISVYTFITYRSVQGIITVGDLVIYFQAFQKGKLNLNNALESFIRLVENRMFLTYISDFLNLKSKLIQSASPIAIPKPIQYGIEFKNVGFHYPEQTGRALEDISITFKKGKLYAIVGENGSGKSTLLKLLCRLYDPIAGKIMLDNQSISAYDLDAYQQQISVTFQDFVKYQFTVKDNITLDHMANENPEKLNNLLSSTGAKDFVDALPDKLGQKLGKQYNDGLDLSLGQWQKIAIARALYRDASVILMDEPTSAIDPLAEHTIFEKLKSLSKDKIVVLVTHRLYNLKLADKILVMDGGKVVERGTHNELIELKQKYFRMFEKQTV